jgi:transposase
LLARRNADCAQTPIDAQAKGIVTTDRYSGYQWLPQRRRQICWAQLKRDFQASAERTGEAGKIGTQLLAQVKALFKQWHQYRASDLRPQLVRRLTPLKTKIKKLLQAGSQLGHTKTRHTCQHILKVWEALWTFVRVEGVEPTNNNAERPLRRAVLRRRKSFGTQSATGSTFVARILTTITTLRQQKHNVLAYLAQACNAFYTEHTS